MSGRKPPVAVYLIGAVLVHVLTFCTLAAFIQWDVNPGNWESHERAALCAVLVLLLPLSIAAALTWRDAA